MVTLKLVKVDTPAVNVDDTVVAPVTPSVPPIEVFPVIDALDKVVAPAFTVVKVALPDAVKVDKEVAPVIFTVEENVPTPPIFMLPVILDVPVTSKLNAGAVLPIPTKPWPVILIASVGVPPDGLVKNAMFEFQFPVAEPVATKFIILPVPAKL